MRGVASQPPIRIDYASPNHPPGRGEAWVLDYEAPLTPRQRWRRMMVVFLLCCVAAGRILLFFKFVR
jgi:hypothetical protein